jgi:DNA-binding winged helix-turn-helix (wHTH) protein
MRQAFGDCVFDRDRRELTRQGSIVHGAPKLLALLELLLDAAPRAVTKEEIHKRSGRTRLWLTRRSPA